MTPFATAPKTPAATALPIDRRNMFAPVTTPCSVHGTDDCVAMSVGEATSPSPRPTTKQERAVVQGLGTSEAATRPMSTEHRDAEAEERGVAEADAQEQPPDCEAEIGQPSVSAATARPEMIGVALAVTSRKVGT